ncbi:bpX6 domain-containing protein [Hyalangium rubrum]|uniref:BpX6 domain-containing protein n=1 Tax=Hyalangium rubrum TaxID=3103134 RepID=A0ABU5H975_9BACT|nr:bpX6 domain-containing protein [Hyalangium sp. s54d21]MDY7230029.1 bpX6 domain-containing protein [Hyalangium sp. s54d21]
MSRARPVKPRLHVHRGTVVASALWFDPALLGEREARGRVLATWAPGINVFEVAGGFLLRLPQPRPVECAAAPGLPLTLEEGVLTSAPLSASERAHLAPALGSVVLVRAGRAEVLQADPSRRVDVSAWLEVSGWSVAAVKGLGAPPPPVAVLEPVTAPARERFGAGIPAPAPEAEALRARMEGQPVDAKTQEALAAKARAQGSWWDRLRAWLRGENAPRRPEAPVSAASASAPEAASSPSLVGRLSSWLRRTLGSRGPEAAAKPALPSGATSPSKPRKEAPPGPPSWLSRLLGRLRQAFSGSEEVASPSASRGAGAPPPPEPQGPGLFSRLTEWMLRNTPLGPLLGQRKAEYVRRLFDMFEQGNLDEALRYAIPLGKGMTESARIALGLPGPRESITLQPARGGGGKSLFGGGEEIYSALQERYRAAFRKLEREGRIDEAAFVLSELLGEHEEAVSFLEKHERLGLAAELAEGRGLAPGLVVRQWLLAKDLKRAVAIARRSGAFSDAVLRLERTHPAEARTLRLLWAESLAEAGDYLRAATVVWPLEDARPLARSWLEHGSEVGGVGGARALARLVAAFPVAFEGARAPTLALLEDEGRERAAERMAFAEVLAAEARSDTRTVLVGPVVRSLLRDRAAGHTRIDTNLLTLLLRDAGDGTLRADLPPVSDPRRHPWIDESGAALLTERLGATEAGPYPIHDAVALSGQRLLLALGEAGVRMVRTDGRRVAHFDVPAFSLVPSVHEDRVLALAPRGELKRISRIELGSRRATHWCDAKVDAFAPSYDGSLWFIAERDTVMAVDALNADGLKALWRVSEVGGPVLALEVDVELRFATWGEEPQLWTYVLPGGPTLRSRVPRRSGDGLPMLSLDPLTGQVERLDHWVYMPPWTVSCVPTPVGQEVVLLSRGSTVRARFLLEGETRARVRFSPGELLVFDVTGRLLRVDLTEGSARRVPLS